MTAADVLSTLKESEIKCLMRRGLLSVKAIDYLDLYKAFTSKRSKGVKLMTAYTELSEEFELHETTVRKVVNNMGKSEP